MLKLLVGGLLLACWPWALQAQSSPAGAVGNSRFYVGIGFNAGRYSVMGDYLNESRPWASYSPVVAAGVQLSPTWGLQLRATAYRTHRHGSWEGLDYQNAPSQPQLRFSSWATEQRTIVVPVLARYTFRFERARRTHVNALMGIAGYHIKRHHTQQTTDIAGNVVFGQNSTQTFTRLQLWGGFGLQYAVAPRLELAGELLMRPEYQGYFFQLHPNVSTELRYRFGFRKS